MTTSRELLQQALSAWDDEQGMKRLCETMVAIRAHLAKELVPLCWVLDRDVRPDDIYQQCYTTSNLKPSGKGWTPLYRLEDM